MKQEDKWNIGQEKWNKIRRLFILETETKVKINSKIKHYDRLIWEFVILGGLFIFFYLNKLLYNYLIQKEGSIELKGGKKKNEFI